MFNSCQRQSATKIATKRATCSALDAGRSWLLSSVDFESTDRWDVIDELADDFVEVRCARVQATLCRAEATRAAEFQNHSAQDDVPQVQYRCKARYAKDAKDGALASCMALLPTPGTDLFPSCKATSVEMQHCVEATTPFV